MFERMRALILEASGKSSPVKAPVMLFKPHGTCPDEIDALRAGTGYEDPERWEAAVLKAQEEARSDPAVKEMLESVYLQSDRQEAFASFLASGIPAAISRFIARFGVSKESHIADVGCGPGHLAYSLRSLGYAHVTAMDPNAMWHTGTGYLKSICGNGITIINDLAAWDRLIGEHDAIVSQGTVHHWSHIPTVALGLRRAMKPGAFWFAFNEFVANTPADLVSLMLGHPTATRYGSYEWAYPASVYVDLIQSVGFNLVATVPYYWHDNELIGSMRPKPPEVDREELDRFVDEHLVEPGGTVERFWEEVDQFRRRGDGNRLFTDPQAFVFQRIAG